MGKLDWLSEPLTKGLDLDDPNTTAKRVHIIQKKVFLHRIYEEWYELINNSLPEVGGPILELGSGAGFLKETIPDLITSEVFHLSGINLVTKGENFPFPSKSLRAIVMIDVLHHIPNVRAFFQESARCIKSGGRIALIEPWVTPWSRIIYKYLHHEPFDPESKDWEFPVTGPLSSANDALPWILFHRDKLIFEKEFPMWKIQPVQLMMPFRYLVCGGVSKRSLVPASSYNFWRGLEQSLGGQMKNLAMFANIVLVRA